MTRFWCSIHVIHGSEKLVAVTLLSGSLWPPLLVNLGRNIIRAPPALIPLCRLCCTMQPSITFNSRGGRILHTTGRGKPASTVQKGVSYRSPVRFRLRSSNSMRSSIGLTGCILDLPESCIYLPVPNRDNPIVDPLIIHYYKCTSKKFSLRQRKGGNERNPVRDDHEADENVVTPANSQLCFKARRNGGRHVGSGRMEHARIPRRKPS